VTILGVKATDLVKMAELMEANGYKNVRLSGEHLGIPFQIVAEGKAALNKSTVLVRYIKDLDAVQAARIGDEFLDIDKQSRSVLWGKVFLYCLMADRVDVEPAAKLLNRLHDNEYRLTNIGGGGGAMLIVEVTTGRMAAQKSVHPGLWIWRLKKVLPELLDQRAAGT